MAKSWNAAAISQKWAQKMNDVNTQNAYKAGINALTVSPTALAATPDATTAYLNGIQQAVQSGRRAAALQAVTVQQFQAAANAKSGNLGTGATLALPKHQAAIGKLIPIWQNIQSQLASVPKQPGNVSVALQRSAVAIQTLMAAKQAGQTK